MKDPAFLFYSQDFFTGVATLDWEERGKYITLLCLMHQQGRMDEKTIRFLVGSVSDNLKRKFRIDEQGLWYNDRLEQEVEKRAKFTASRRENGSLGGRPKKNKPSGKPSKNLMHNHMGTHMGNENENENETVIEIWPTFEDFWNEVIHKVGRDDAKAYWNGRVLKNGKKITHEDKEEIMQHYPLYAASIEDPQMIRRPKTYLYNSTWKDEIIRSKKSAGGLSPITERRLNDFLRSAGS